MSNVIEALSISDVIDYNDAVGVAIVAVSDGSKSLLSCRIPLSGKMITRTSLAFSPLTLIVLVFCMRENLQNLRRWC